MDVDYFRYLGQKVRTYPYRRPRGFSTYEETVADSASGHAFEARGLDVPIGHRELMYMVGALLALLALGLIISFVVLGLAWT